MKKFVTAVEFYDIASRFASAVENEDYSSLSATDSQRLKLFISDYPDNDVSFHIVPDSSVALCALTGEENDCVKLAVISEFNYANEEVYIYENNEKCSSIYEAIEDSLVLLSSNGLIEENDLQECYNTITSRIDLFYDNE